jgi:16S rRNA (guanine527-N7)-methyltransferase
MTEEEAQVYLLNTLLVSRETFEQLEAFIAYLRREAQSQNLISASTLDHIWARHIADSAQLLGHLPNDEWRNWLDLGSGAGFPGLVIGILTGKRITLVESRARRIDYLQRAVIMLGLEKNVMVEGCALEKVKSAQYDVISARAFAPLPRLLNGAARFSTENTRWLLPKGRNAAMELAELGQEWQHSFEVVPSITDDDAGILIGTLSGARSKSSQKRAING